MPLPLTGRSRYSRATAIFLVPRPCLLQILVEQRRYLHLCLCCQRRYRKCRTCCLKFLRERISSRWFSIMIPAPTARIFGECSPAPISKCGLLGYSIYCIELSIPQTPSANYIGRALSRSKIGLQIRRQRHDGPFASSNGWHLQPQWEEVFCI